MNATPTIPLTTRVLATCQPCRATLKAPKASPVLDEFFERHNGHGEMHTWTARDKTGVWSEGDAIERLKAELAGVSEKSRLQRLEIVRLHTELGHKGNERTRKTYVRP